MRLYPHHLDVTSYPDYHRRAVRVPTWETFGGNTRFTCLRLFAQENGRLTEFERELDLYVDRQRLVSSRGTSRCRKNCPQSTDVPP